MNKLRRARKFASIALAALAIVLAVNAPSQARGGGGGHGFGGGHPSGGGMRHDFDGRHDFDRRHDFDGRNHGFLFGFGGVYPYDPYYYPPAYGNEAPAYWYYCPSYGAYYPNVVSCPEAWVPVPAS